MNAGSETVSLRQSENRLFETSQSPTKQPADDCEHFYELSRRARWSIDHASFYQLLSWLDPDPEIAGHEYEIIRRKLIRLFTSRQCMFPEDLADITFDRVAKRLSLIKQYYVGNPLNYFIGVAKKVYLEQFHTTSPLRQPPLPAGGDETNELFRRLEDCINKLTHRDRELVLSYYQTNGRAKIDGRKKLAEELGIPLGALRLRVHRIVSRMRDIDRTCNGAFP